MSNKLIVGLLIIGVLGYAFYVKNQEAPMTTNSGETAVGL